MMSSHVSHPVALPKCWTRHVRSALLQAISLAATAWTLARSRAATSRRQRKRLQVALPNYGVGAALGSCKVNPCHWIGTESASRESLGDFTGNQFTRFSPAGYWRAIDHIAAKASLCALPFTPSPTSRSPRQ